tara:strand:- start:2203 stop:2502 length:300 start_codon:yes stop_codon:yes gene_type:complete
MHIDDKITFDSGLNILQLLLNGDNFNKSIVIVGKTIIGKNYIVSKCKELIRNKKYKIKNSHNEIKLNYFEDKNIVLILDVNQIKDIDINKYFLINLNTN